MICPAALYRYSQKYVLVMCALLIMRDRFSRTRDLSMGRHHPWILSVKLRSVALQPYVENPIIPDERF
jgi:hypothetical protein